jgi:hypothetical protein
MGQSRKNISNSLRRRKTAKCHPNVNNAEKSHIKSCLDDNDIRLLVNEWNKNNKEKIQYRKRDIEGSLSRLYDKMTTCDNDICLLNALDDPIKRKKLEKTKFAPKAPTSWKFNKNEWLTNLDIDAVMRQYEETLHDFKFLGVTPIDFEHKDSFDDTCYSPEICEFDIRDHYGKTPYKRFGIVFNTHPHTSSGEHWICMLIDLKQGKMFFFDSNGNKEPNEITSFVKKIQQQAKSISKTIVFDSNEGVQHQNSNTECGMYCLYFLINVLDRKRKFDHFKNPKIRISDSKIEKFREIYFNKL